MKKSWRFLYLEDRPEDVERVREHLAREYLPAELVWVNTRSGFLSALRDAWNFDLLLVDPALPDFGGDEALERARELAPNLPFIFLAGSLGEEEAVACLRRGATDYVLKTNLARLAPVIRRALEEARQAGARREAEAASGRVAALLRATLESTREGILLVDLAGRISAYNRKFLSLCGIPEYVMAPMELDQVIQHLASHFQDPGALLEEARLLRSRSERESAGLLRINDGQVLEELGRPQKVGGETVGRVLSLREAPDRTLPGEMLEAINGNRQGLGEAAQAARVVPWLLTDDLLVLPDSGAAMLGAAPKDLAALAGLLHPDDADLLKEALEGGQNVSFQARVRQADGSWRWIRWIVDRSPNGYRGVLMDITEQVWLQDRGAQRRRRDGAREMARKVAGKLLDHLETADRSLRPLEGQVAPAQGFQALDQARQFLEQLRSFAHLGRPAKVLVQPDAFLARILPAARAAAGPGIRIEHEPVPGLPELALDPLQIEQALAALLANARQALLGNGTIRLASGLLKPRAHRPGSLPGPGRSRVFFEVRDAGPGIPKGLQKQVFEPFFSTALDQGRFGLGLTLVEDIALAHDGSVQLESGPGQGTRIRILLPV